MSDQEVIVPRPRPPVLLNITEKVRSGCGNLYVTVTFYDGKPFEIFPRLGKQKSCFAAGIDALSRAVSYGLRAGVPVEYYLKSCRGIECEGAFATKDGRVKSCYDALATCIVECMEKFRQTGLLGQEVSHFHEDQNKTHTDKPEDVSCNEPSDTSSDR